MVRHEATQSALNEMLEVNETNASILGEAFWNLAHHYGLTREEQALLLGLKPNKQRLISLEATKRIPEDPDKFARVGNLLGIHKNLRILFPHNRRLVYQWMKLPHEMLENQSPLSFIKMGADTAARIFVIRRKLDQIRCAR